MEVNNAINDVRRKINEVMKKTDERIVVGWRPDMATTRQEGDVWEDMSGKKWTIKNGVKQTVTKLDAAKTPWFCPVCDKVMNHKLDNRYYNIRGKCMDCAIKEETKMRYEGTWEAYARQQLQNNYIAGLRDKIAELQHYHDTVSNPEFIYADDTNILMVERWDIDLNKVREDLQQEITQLTQHLNELLEIQNGTV